MIITTLRRSAFRYLRLWILLVLSRRWSLVSFASLEDRSRIEPVEISEFRLLTPEFSFVSVSSLAIINPV
jgi:hypothetical protein